MPAMDADEGLEEVLGGEIFGPGALRERRLRGDDDRPVRGSRCRGRRRGRSRGPASVTRPWERASSEGDRRVAPLSRALLRRGASAATGPCRRHSSPGEPAVMRSDRPRSRGRANALPCSASARRAVHRGRHLWRGRRGRTRAGRYGRRPCRAEGETLHPALRPRPDVQGESRTDRAPRLRRPSGLHGEDPELTHRRSARGRPPRALRHHRAQRDPRRRRSLRPSGWISSTAGWWGCSAAEAGSSHAKVWRASSQIATTAGCFT
jgi:hypothetical protein